MTAIGLDVFSAHISSKGGPMKTISTGYSPPTEIVGIAIPLRDHTSVGYGVVATEGRAGLGYHKASAVVFWRLP